MISSYETLLEEDVSLEITLMIEPFVHEWLEHFPNEGVIEEFMGKS